MKKNYQEIIVGLVLIIMCTLTMAFWGNQKEVWFCDEIYTYESANGFEQEWPAENIDTWMSGEDVEKFFSADSGRFQFSEISNRLYCDHVPLYFWIFRAVSVLFFAGSGSIQIGMVINLAFYIVAAIIVYKMLIKVTDKPLAAGVITALAFIVNRLMLEQVTMLRMYIMLTCLEIALLACSYSIVKNAIKRKIKITDWIILFLSSLAGFLCHYDYWIFYAITAAVSCLFMLFFAVYRNKKKWNKDVLFYTIIIWIADFAISLFTTTLLFPYCKWNLKRGKGDTAINSIFVFSKEKLDHILWGLRRISQSFWGDGFPWIIGLILFALLTVSGLLILKRRGKKTEASFLLGTVLIALLYMFAVCFTLPDVEEERYLWGGLTVLTICTFFNGWLLLEEISGLFKHDRDRTIFKTVGAISLISIVLVVQIIVIDSGNGIAYLKNPTKDHSLLEDNKDIPWIVYGSTVGVYSYYDWLIPKEICFISMDGTNEDIECVKRLTGEEKFLVYVYEDFEPEAREFFENCLSQKIASSYLTRSTNLSVYSFCAKE